MLKGGVLIVCRAVGSNFVVALAVPMAVHRGAYIVAKFFSPSFFSRLDGFS